jgi:hypothetical protein
MRAGEAAEAYLNDDWCTVVIVEDADGDGGTVRIRVDDAEQDVCADMVRPVKRAADPPLDCATDLRPATRPVTPPPANAAPSTPAKGALRASRSRTPSPPAKDAPKGAAPKGGAAPAKGVASAKAPALAPKASRLPGVGPTSAIKSVEP